MRWRYRKGDIIVVVFNDGGVIAGRIARVTSTEYVDFEKTKFMIQLRHTMSFAYPVEKHWNIFDLGVVGTGIRIVWCKDVDEMMSVFMAEVM